MVCLSLSGCVEPFPNGPETYVATIVGGVPAWATSGGGGGTDDQFASEVPVTDIPEYTGLSDVQAVLEAIATDVAAFADTDDQVASEVPITAIAALPGDANVQEALETLAIRPYRLMMGFGDAAAVTTGDTITFRAPDAFTVTSVRASVQTASSSGLIDVDVKKNGATIFFTRVTIDSGEETSVTAATPSVLSVTAVADNDELMVEVIDDGTGAMGLVVAIKGTYP